MAFGAAALATSTPATAPRCARMVTRGSVTLVRSRLCEARHCLGGTKGAMGLDFFVVDINTKPRLVIDYKHQNKFIENRPFR